ncbi:MULTISPECIES: hypothetical protein [unclassified Paenarthrobacter]|uniref:hypothetical protein n=1 Tax=unclassified Paenarthrobacter TaxID=2634190 RepID=UPI00084EB9CA|nr:hypothetical protein [Paenarthrobacter sp. R1]NKR13632.1 hypothetical protein [Arthrobacter sp. M5]NKR15475.1 hypothetical protein [Arthrobacter sp. M6]OEH58489.1 hypothetical protein A5N17_21440 [Arthrobacter sp. D2]OEH64346.1 hypothetical protein A5N13_12225 [Arthrobacter sp. D4]WIV29222.1 hypothetical protein QN084_12640 [Paenarthrobacter sp. R1]
MNTKPNNNDDPEARHRRHRRLVRIGQVIMAAGAVVGIWHWILHLAPAGQGPSVALDLYAGYPTAGLLFLAGALLAGRTEAKR